MLRPGKQIEKKHAYKRVKINTRPRPARQLLYVGAVVVSLAVGYGVALLVQGDASRTQPPATETMGENQTSGNSSASNAWYRQQTEPPAFINQPLPPIFPEPEPEVTVIEQPKPAPLPYEESLPQETYEPPIALKPVVNAVVETETPAAVAPPVVMTPRMENAPVVVDADKPLWQRNAVALAQGDVNAPKITIVIDDMGVDQSRTAKITALPGPLTVSFLTYADQLDEQTRAARDAGHELMAHVSMEPGSRTVDPGPHVLLSDDDKEKTLENLRWGLARFSGYVGINNHMGSRFTASETAMRIVLDEIQQRGLLFLDSRTSASSVAGRMAREMGVPYAERNIFLDNKNEVEAVVRQLEKVERLAQKFGHAVAIGHPRDATITALSMWLPGLAEKGIVLAPLSTQVELLARQSNQHAQQVVN